jgi:sugar fermentation stimulation protein A
VRITGEDEPSRCIQSGIYVGVWLLRAPVRLRMRHLGQVRLPAGFYAYVGSAQRNLPARLARHARRNKKRQWHIDWLSTRAVMLGALVLEGDKAVECQVAAALADLYPRPASGFGSSDCRCRSHLFLLGPWLE